MFGYTHGRYLMAKTTPLLILRTMMTGATPGAADPAAEDEAKADDIRQAMDESSHGPKRAEAIARPLGIRRGVNRHCRLLLQIDQLLGYCSFKATPSTWHYSYLGHRTKTML
jgi:hypothetical protein